MQEVLLFSGTSEGRKLAEILSKHAIRVTVCVATEYGQEVMEEAKLIEVRVGRLKQEEMEMLIEEKDWLAVIDATHPFAVEVTENIKKACEKQNREVLRLLRNTYEPKEQENTKWMQTERKSNKQKQTGIAQLQTEEIFYVNSTEEAAEYVSHTQGNIFLTTGSKELSKYVEKISDVSRIYARILPGEAELEKCHKLGLKGRQIICMQGPFSEDLNFALLKEINAAYLVTKETAGAGGYPEKLRAATRAGVKVIAIKRPEESGYSMEEMFKKLGVEVSTGNTDTIAHSREENNNRKSSCFQRKISLVGIGMGNVGTLTVEACETIREAQLLIGASRMLASVPETLKSGKEQLISYQPQEIVSYVENHSKYEKIAVLLSGDIGFYSGAHLLLEKLKEMEKKAALSYEIEMICGISSVVYFAAKLGMTWEDMCLMSLHGRSQNVIGALQQWEKVFTLTEGAKGVQKMSKELIQYGMKDVTMYMGRQLGSTEEEIEKGTPEAFTEYVKEGLCVLVLVNEKAGAHTVTHGISDTEFLRDKVPMTKEEVRSISLSKLALHRDSVVYDIGAGTGSISIECAKMAVDGQVYAIEKKPEACKLLEQNKYKFAAANLELIPGEAPEVLADLPTPTHVFIGGSSGKMEEILTAVWEKNMNVRIVINAISLETIAEVTQLMKKYEFVKKEIVQVTVAKAKEIGDYQMMMGQNPVYVVTLQREEEEQ